MKTTVKHIIQLLNLVGIYILFTLIVGVVMSPTIDVLDSEIEIELSELEEKESEEKEFEDETDKLISFVGCNESALASNSILRSHLLKIPDQHILAVPTPPPAADEYVAAGR